MLSDTYKMKEEVGKAEFTGSYLIIIHSDGICTLYDIYHNLKHSQGSNYIIAKHSCKKETWYSEKVPKLITNYKCIPINGYQDIFPNDTEFAITRFTVTSRHNW